jgi:hypothetical protein
MSVREKAAALLWPDRPKHATIERMTSFGNGPTLKEASPCLRDDKSRIEQILTVTEINSVMEGLPPFDNETRERIGQALATRCVPDPTPER